jgi:hypothetical protein
VYIPEKTNMHLTEPLQKKALESFWNDVENSGSKKARLKSMKIMSELVFYEETKPWQSRRYYWIRTLKDRCLSCGGSAEAAHHIIQLQHGGIDQGENVAFVCHECHRAIHPWMN